eukprot:COSAG06_NODE_417_length_15986_cov_832.025493_10_plen_95_part_00
MALRPALDESGVRTLTTILTITAAIFTWSPTNASACPDSQSDVYANDVSQGFLTRQGAVVPSALEMLMAELSLSEVRQRLFLFCAIYKNARIYK